MAMRYAVFKQEQFKQPHYNVGSVHAADAEMALLNARDVFGRRPNAVSMWVAPESAIFARTAEQLAEIGDHTSEPFSHANEFAIQTYCIFRKISQRRAMTYVGYVGEVIATNCDDALKKAIATYPADEVFVWWVVPKNAITATETGAEKSWFDPALDKSYRQQSYYNDATRSLKNK
jgi:ring-1,2-phenylacetyl-CoA epoxidase subunit PaaB